MKVSRPNPWSVDFGCKIPKYLIKISGDFLGCLSFQQNKAPKHAPQKTLQIQPQIRLQIPLGFLREPCLEKVGQPLAGQTSCQEVGVAYRKPTFKPLKPLMTRETQGLSLSANRSLWLTLSVQAQAHVLPPCPQGWEPTGMNFWKNELADNHVLLRHNDAGK